MKWFFRIMFAFLFIQPVFAQIVTSEHRILFDYGCKSFLGNATANSKTFNNTDWRILELPHDWNIEGAWGYSQAMEDCSKMISFNQLKRALADVVTRNMSLLLNVGPDRYGVISTSVSNLLQQTDGHDYGIGRSTNTEAAWTAAAENGC